MAGRKYIPSLDGDVTEASKAAIAAIKRLVAELPIDDSMTEAASKAAQIGSRVPLEAIALAATLLENDPGRFPDFDAKEVRGAIQHIQAMNAVADALEKALGRVRKSAAKRRKAAADVTLVLYAMLKGLGRLGLVGKEALLVKQLQDHLTTYKTPRAERVPKREVAAMKKVLKSTKVASAATSKAAKARGDLDVASAQVALQEKKAKLGA